ncbi:NADase-type glycan-binding domain-containing protein [Aquimarina muelleri]|uniref:Hint domain-containing protein n=1 Tax=Aquimarina muelleri TaxID=279356 RepID=A0A918N494_9FLAO|nr:hypothetical protein [Aquimarina muelleri]MCX2763303.1 hypothetical protein [Aquimarina muelleri]GGX26184.1 hypothetical protein GCM10007384_29110 [Aquimarina muelleri]
MKILFKFILLIFTTSALAQELDTLHTTIGETFDFGIEVQNNWKKRDQLLADLESGKKNWDNLTKEEGKLFEKYDETYGSMWDIEGGGCSWYCGAGGYTVKTSSQLSPNGVLNYKSENLTDFSYQTAWVEGKSGDGIGESIEFSFPPVHPRVSTIIIANGYIKSKKHWKDNSRVHKLKMYINNKPYAIIELKDVYAKQLITLKKNLGYSERDDLDILKEKENWNVKLEIISVYKGNKYDDTAITEIYFDGLDVHCLAKGTLVTMGDNSLKEIELLNIGDEILSFNTETKKNEISVITELANPIHKDLIKIDFSNNTSITCTKDHPFLSIKSQWTSNDPKKTERDYEISNVTLLKLGSKIKTLHEIIEVVKITEIKSEQKTYTIVNLNKNKTFIANGIITGIEKLRIQKRCTKHSL